MWRTRGAADTAGTPAAPLADFRKDAEDGVYSLDTPDTYDDVYRNHVKGGAWRPAGLDFRAKLDTDEKAKPYDLPASADALNSVTSR